MYKIYNSQFKKEVTTISPGDVYVTADNEILSTILGSCIAVCLSDPLSKVAGMNHFMLPKSSREESVSFTENIQSPQNFYHPSLRFGTASMELLIGELQKIGAQRKNFVAKIFGGGNILKSNSIDVGDRNIGFIRNYLNLENIPLLSEDVGEKYGRHIYFITHENKVLLKKVTDDSMIDLKQEEESFEKQADERDKAGTVDLF